MQAMLKSLLKRVLPPRAIGLFHSTVSTIENWGSLEGKGERVDITYNKELVTGELHHNAQGHFARYQFAANEVIESGKICGDFACGTGYGTAMLAKNSARVVGADLNEDVIKMVRRRYTFCENAQFLAANLLSLNYDSCFDYIVSFETVEHFAEKDIPRLLAIFHRALKPGGRIILSTPYMQKRSELAIKMGFHLTFDIDERKLSEWLNQRGFQIEYFRFQNCQNNRIEKQHTPDIKIDLDYSEVMLCVASKI